MPRLDVYLTPGRGSGYVVGVQASLFDEFATRAVIPLLPRVATPPPLRELNPVFDIDGAPHVLLAQVIASVPARELCCPVASLARKATLFCGLTKAGRLTGAELSDKAVVRPVKPAAEGAGLDPMLYSGRSLRVGLATAAGDVGADLAELMRQARHRSTEVALGDLRPADLWRNYGTQRLFASAAASDAGQGREA